LRAQFARLALDSTREPPQLDWIVVSDYLRRGPRRTLASARHMLRHPMLERAREVRVPAVVLRGERDPIVSPAWASSLAAALGCEVVTITAAAHCAHFTHPHAVVSAASGLV
jgi:pimeloyl-ACP methyl ester carboxylesterase